MCVQNNLSSSYYSLCICITAVALPLPAQAWQIPGEMLQKWLSHPDRVATGLRAVSFCCAGMGSGLSAVFAGERAGLTRVGVPAGVVRSLSRDGTGTPGRGVSITG